MIASVSEVYCGLEKWWIKVRSKGGMNDVNFGKLVSKKYVKAFVSAAPHCFIDKEWYHTDKRDRMWVVFLLCIENHICRRK